MADETPQRRHPLNETALDRALAEAREQIKRAAELLRRLEAARAAANKQALRR
jgi:hypothetical protein